MKEKAILLIILAASLSLSAQIKKGTFMLEGGINLSGNWDYYDSSPFIESFGISFGTSDHIGKDYVTENEKVISSTKDFGFSVAPRLGYFLFRDFVVGTDFKYMRNIHKYSIYTADDESIDHAILYGFFARKYFGNKKLTPFVEGGFGFWSSKHSQPSYSSGGGRYQENRLTDWSYYAGALGCSYSVNSKFRINLFAKLQHTKEVPSYMSITKILHFDSALVLSFSYFLNRKIKE